MNQVLQELIERDIEFLQFRLLAGQLLKFRFHLDHFEGEPLSLSFNLKLFGFQGRD